MGLLGSLLVLRLQSFKGLLALLYFPMSFPSVDPSSLNLRIRTSPISPNDVKDSPFDPSSAPPPCQ
ncbi:Hypothetical protein FKW44_013391 [Caligus rogercresseyi]|uniref:Uncharacterized protein n=1 Tax=Caligus rogercresseyi TaxID=217165 RepID=A0A7T8HL42_CALRO|nr:Hypothetical protein FKW44_013391 [Caligus rogercresseyi]